MFLYCFLETACWIVLKPQYYKVLCTKTVSKDIKISGSFHTVTKSLRETLIEQKVKQPFLIDQVIDRRTLSHLGPYPTAQGQLIKEEDAHTRTHTHQCLVPALTPFVQRTAASPQSSPC